MKLDKYIYILCKGVKLHMNLGHLVVRFFFLNSGNLICRSTDISMYFREFLGVRDNEIRLYSKTMTDLHSVFAYRSLESNALWPFLICLKAP